MATNIQVAIELVGKDLGAGKLLGGVVKDLQGVDAAAGKAGSKQGGLGGLLDGFGKLGLAGIGVSAVAGAVQGLGGALLGPIGAASDLAESVSKVGVVFGPAAGQIEKFASTSAQALGLTKNETLAAAGAMGNMFSSMGMTGAASADLSIDMVKMASDFASFNNIPVPEALEKIRAGLTGEAEPLRSMGVLLNEAAVKAKAMEMGLADARGELSESAKVQARAALIMEQGSKAQGDFARTSTGLANSQKIITASFGDLTTQIGSRLLPVIAPLVSQFATALPAAIDMVMPILDTLGDAFQTMGAFLTSYVIPQLQDLGAVVGKVFGGDFEGAVALLSTSVLPRLQEFGQSVLAWIGAMVPPLLAQLGLWASEFLAWIGPMIPPMLVELGTMAANVLAWLGEQVPVLVAQLGLWAQEFVAFIGPMIPPMLAELGVVAGSLFAWIAGQAPILVATLLGTWIPAFLGWILPAIPPLLNQLGHILLAVGGWIVNTAAPELGAFALSMGAAIIAGLMRGLAPIGEAIGAEFSALGTRMRNAGAALAEQLKQGFLNIPIVAAVRGVVGQIRDLLPGSLAKLGPLSKPVRWGDTLNGNLPAAAKDLTRAVGATMGGVRGELLATGDVATVVFGAGGAIPTALQETAAAAAGMAADVSGAVARTSQELAALLNARSTAAGLINNFAFPTGGAAGPAPSGGAAKPPITVIPLSQETLPIANAPAFDWAKYNFENQGKPRDPSGVVKLAGGGWLTEPVLGMGLTTGRRYAMAEQEAEYVLPASRMGAGQGGGGLSTAQVMQIVQTAIRATLAGLPPVQVNVDGRALFTVMRDQGQRWGRQNGSVGLS